MRYLTTLPKLRSSTSRWMNTCRGFTSNQALLDIIAQHFFQKTPAYFALSYFSLYQDYRYPRGGTGSFPKAMERFILEHGGEIRTETQITGVDPAKKVLVDSAAMSYAYRKLVWAADLKALYRLLGPLRYARSAGGE